MQEALDIALEAVEDADGDPVEGHEQGGLRPWLVVSSNPLNAMGLLFAMPLTTKRLSRTVPLHVPLQPPEGGVSAPSLILCDQRLTR